MQVEEIRHYNAFKFHPILCSGMAIIMGQKFVKNITFLFTLYAHYGIFTSRKSAKIKLDRQKI